jgi:hypothetical protein
MDCPGPLTNCDFDWAWWWGAPLTSNSGLQKFGNGAADTNIISKARRRLGNDQALLVVAEALGEANWDFHMHARVLIKE